MRDFTYQIYDELCKAIAGSKYKTITFDDYFKGKNLPDHFIILRHDVDKWPENAVELAKIEKKYGLRSTYYWRNVKHVYTPSMIREQAKMGHEIGYHYETLAQAGGDYEKALAIFTEWLEKMRKEAEVTTICMHGSRFTKWDNRHLWKTYNFKDYGITGEPYLSIDYADIKYISDSGGSWLNKGQRTRDNINDIDNELIYSTHDLIGLIRKGTYKKIVILAHPDRWNDNMLVWHYENVTKKLRNMVKSAYNALKKN